MRIKKDWQAHTQEAATPVSLYVIYENTVYRYLNLKCKWSIITKRFFHLFVFLRAHGFCLSTARAEDHSPLCQDQERNIKQCKGQPFSCESLLNHMVAVFTLSYSYCFIYFKFCSSSVYDYHLTDPPMQSNFLR